MASWKSSNFLMLSVEVCLFQLWRDTLNNSQLGKAAAQKTEETPEETPESTDESSDAKADWEIEVHFIERYSSTVEVGKV